MSLVVVKACPFSSRHKNCLTPFGCQRFFDTSRMATESIALLYIRTLERTGEYESIAIRLRVLLGSSRLAGFAFRPYTA